MTGYVWDYDESMAMFTSHIIKTFPDGSCEIKLSAHRLSHTATFMHYKLAPTDKK
jgi:hypothetical protein